MTDIITATTATDLVLKHAVGIGLPMPWAVDITDHRPVGLTFDTVAKVAEWAQWLGAQVSEQRHPQPLAPAITYAAEGDALDLPVRCWALVAGAEVAS